MCLRGPGSRSGNRERECQRHYAAAFPVGLWERPSILIPLALLVRLFRVPESWGKYVDNTFSEVFPTSAAPVKRPCSSNADSSRRSNHLENGNPGRTMVRPVASQISLSTLCSRGCTSPVHRGRISMDFMLSQRSYTTGPPYTTAKKRSRSCSEMSAVCGW